MPTNLLEKKDVGGESPLVFEIINLNTKIKNNIYKFKEVLCFCGKDNSVEVLDADRYGIFYSVHLCKHCGLMFAKNQMTVRSEKQFYNNEYRKIYDYNLKRSEEFGDVASTSDAFKDFLKENDVSPKVIFEIGCNEGSMLYSFKDSCEIYGVDYHKENIDYGKSKGLNLICGGIEKLEELDKKADFIILHHVIEHFTDLETTLKRISKLLTKDGVIYISVPGFYGYDLDHLFQNAHNWQFTANTLEYVMTCCGYEAIYLDGEINSLWRYTDGRRDKLAVWPNESKDIWGFGFSGKNYLPYLTAHCKFPLKDRKDNIKKALSYKFPDIRELFESEKGNNCIVISGAPSINNYIKKIKELKLQGYKIVSIDRMYVWCLNNNIIPDYVVVIDGHENVVDSFKKLNKKTKHIMSSICKKEICEILKDYETYIFTSEQAGVYDLGNTLDNNDYGDISLMNVGGSVGLAGFVVGMYLGMKNIHIFGFDCHIMDGLYAEGISDNGAERGEMAITVDGKDWISTASYISFVQQFFELYTLGENTNMLDSVKIYGNSLIKAMSKIDIDGDRKERK